MWTNKKLCFVIPAYKEYENLQKLIPQLHKLFPEAIIVISDDNSKDGTEQLISDLQAQNFPVYLSGAQKKGGIGPAVIRGIKFALQFEPEFIIQMDADFSHSPTDIPTLLMAMEKADVVIGSKFCKDSRIINWPHYRKLLSYLGNLYIHLWLRLPIFEATSGFKCYRTDFLKRINLNLIRSKGYIFQAEILYHLWKAGARLVEVPITFKNRTEGKSKMSFAIVSEGIVQPILIRCKYLRHPSL